MTVEFTLVKALASLLFYVLATVGGTDFEQTMEAGAIPPPAFPTEYRGLQDSFLACSSAEEADRITTEIHTMGFVKTFGDIERPNDDTNCYYIGLDGINEMDYLFIDIALETEVPIFRMNGSGWCGMSIYVMPTERLPSEVAQLYQEAIEEDPITVPLVFAATAHKFCDFYKGPQIVAVNRKLDSGIFLSDEELGREPISLFGSQYMAKSDRLDESDLMADQPVPLPESVPASLEN